jgi:hypothetical protein
VGTRIPPGACSTNHKFVHTKAHQRALIVADCRFDDDDEDEDEDE